MIKGKIVVVDDERIVTSAFKTLLKVEGFSDAHFFNSPKDALAFLKDNQPDLVISDFLMPEMNGYEAAKAIRAMNDRPDGKNIPIIAMTANSFAEDVQASLDAGMNTHLSKPIVIEEVIKTILRYVHND